MSCECPITVVRIPSIITVTDEPRTVTITAPGPQGPPGPSTIGTGQLRLTATAALALSGHRAVTRGSDGALLYASNAVPGHLHAPIWITLGATAALAPTEVLVYGTLEEPSWSWTPQAPLYLGADGLITQTPPNAPAALFLAQIGFATGTASAVFDRGPSIALT